jgi:hypothetical protein
MARPAFAGINPHKDPARSFTSTSISACCRAWNAIAVCNAA